MTFFVILAFVLATILLAIVLERILKSPNLIAITFFSIYILILSILVATEIFTDIAVGLILVIALSVIAYISAHLTRFIKCLCRRVFRNCCNFCNNENIEEAQDNNCLCRQNRNLIDMNLEDRNNGNEEFFNTNDSELNNNSLNDLECESKKGAIPVENRLES